MPLIEPIIRPPAESDSLLLQITTGCSANTCIFCAAYKNKPFRVIDEKTVFNDIEEAARFFPDTRKVFLLDGDALAIKNENLLSILQKINSCFPKLIRISSYANGYNITQRNDEQLNQLAKNKLRLVYIGLESGSQKILDYCKKRSTVEEMVQAVNRCCAVGIKSSVIVLLGLGGKQMSLEHVGETIKAVNKMRPRLLSLLSLMIIPGTILHEQARKNIFRELTARDLLIETRQIIEGLELKDTIFRSNHASNYLSLEGRFPQDKEKLLIILDQAIKGKMPLRPEWMRGL